jgi:hypothetical protein
MPGVGSPPDQTIASMVRSSMAAVVCGSDIGNAVTSLFGSRPATVSSRRPSRSLLEFGLPRETLCPFIPAIEVIPESTRAITCS